MSAPGYGPFVACFRCRALTYASVCEHCDVTHDDDDGFLDEEPVSYEIEDIGLVRYP